MCLRLLVELVLSLHSMVYYAWDRFPGVDGVCLVFPCSVSIWGLGGFCRGGGGQSAVGKWYRNNIAANSSRYLSLLISPRKKKKKKSLSLDGFSSNTIFFCTTFRANSIGFSNDDMVFVSSGFVFLAALSLSLSLA